MVRRDNTLFLATKSPVELWRWSKVLEDDFFAECAHVCSLILDARERQRRPGSSSLNCCPLQTIRHGRDSSKNHALLTR